MSSSHPPRAYPLPSDEAARLATAHRFDFLSDPEFESAYLAGLDHTCELARALFGCDKAYVSFLFEDHQQLVARSNVEVTSTSRAASICAHTICQDDMLVVDDATNDPRFAGKPVVTGDFHVVAYAGTPIQFEGHCVGTFCVVDGKPRAFSEHDLDCMERLTTLVLDQLRVLVAFHELDRACTILRGAERLEARGGWELDFEKHAFVWSEEMRRLHGCTSADPVTLEQLQRFYPNGGSERFLAAIQTASCQHAGFDLELEYTPADGTSRWGRVRGRSESGPERVPRVFGTFRDITDIRRAGDQWRQRRSSTRAR